mmetsp:Transcript_19258/g.27094  ORF Transcript_19258/g.27094 Transcript_19258/m.27094 type:complete len:352 (+) Transcript_19258:138-1193(+)
MKGADLESRGMLRQASAKSMEALRSKRSRLGSVVDTITMQTPLHIAAREGDLATCLILLNDHTVNINAADSSGTTALAYACAPNSGAAPSASASTFSCIVRVLLDHGANPDKANHEGVAPLHLAVEEKNGALVSLLLKHNASASIQNGQHQTPLMLACAKGWLVGVRSLLAVAAGVHYRDIRGRTVLHYASTKRIAQMLVEHGAMVQAKSLREQRTALHEAAISGAISLVRYLVKAGCPIDAQDRDGHTAKDLTTDSKVWDLLNNASASPSAARPSELGLHNKQIEAQREEPTPRRNPVRSSRAVFKSVSGNTMNSPVLRRVKETSRAIKRSPRSQRRVAQSRRLLLARLV